LGVTNEGFRTERDSLGELQVPADALWGAQTQRAIDNFQISGLRMPREFIRALGLIKWAAATTNLDLDALDAKRAAAIQKAALEVAEGRHDAHFPIDVFQTGSGTSSNMNANEVIAHLASRYAGLAVHPNDHVNMSQSSNDVIPTAIHLSALLSIEQHLLPALAYLGAVISRRIGDIGEIVKTGRTHLMDAMWTVEKWLAMRTTDPAVVSSAARSSMASHVHSMLDFQKAGVPTVDYGNNIRQVALEEGVKNAFDFPGFVPAYIRPLFCRGVGPFRWVALSGDPEDIARTDAKVKQLLPDDVHLHRWLDMARERIQFQGLPARICWVGLGDRHRLGLAFNEMVASGELKAPVVIGRDHLDSGSVASPNRETEAMRDGSDAVSDWPLLNALLNTASGATWVSIHHGGGVGMGFSQHAGVVIVCDGTEAAAKRIARVLWNDPATGVMRHADAGYEIALDTAREQKLDLPGITRT
jgi:hypothetical protein